VKINFYDNAIKVEYEVGLEDFGIKLALKAFKNLGLNATITDGNNTSTKFLTFDTIEELDSAKFYMMTYPFFKKENL
jgi:hypothetical protein